MSHHKVAGRPYWGASKETTRLIDEANASGMLVTADQYPYEANMTDLNICIPPKYFVKGGVDGMVEALKNPEMRKQIKAEMQDVNCGYDNFYLNAGGFENIFIAGCPEVKEADGKYVTEWAKIVGKDQMCIRDSSSTTASLYISADLAEHRLQMSATAQQQARHRNITSAKMCIRDRYNDSNAEFLSPLSKAERRQLSGILSKITHKRCLLYTSRCV